MSSYAFEDDQQGPPASSPRDAASGCGAEWICEHRRAMIASLVKFRRATQGAKLAHWQIVDDAVVSFSRGDTGHVVINTGEAPASVKVPTALPAGEYADIVSGKTAGSVGDDGLLRVTVEAQSAVAILGAQ